VPCRSRSVTTGAMARRLDGWFRWVSCLCSFFFRFVFPLASKRSVRSGDGLNIRPARSDRAWWAILGGFDLPNSCLCRSSFSRFVVLNPRGSRCWHLCGVPDALPACFRSFWKVRMISSSCAGAPLFFFFCPKVHVLVYLRELPISMLYRSPPGVFVLVVLCASHPGATCGVPHCVLRSLL